MKTDFKKTLPSYKAKHNDFQIIEVPAMRYLMVDGQGSPEHQDYQDAISTLYPVAYALKFASKQQGKDYVVAPLEALWWADDMSAFTADRKGEWKWTAMLMVPEWITDDMYHAALEKVASKNLPQIDMLTLSSLEEGTSVQFLHIGPYSDEGPILKQLHESFIPDNNLKMVGKHHEIYLSDPRKVATEKLKTIIRQPVA